MKILTRTLFAAYLLVLLWLVLFKFSYDPVGVIREFQTRSVNLVPFAWAQKNEMIANLLAFIPFGVMLSVTLKHVVFKYKLAGIFAFSVAVEIIQYVLAIGVTDITDVMMNTLGGFFGLAVYSVAGSHSDEGYLDRCILIVGMLLLLAILYLRIFVFIVRY